MFSASKIREKLMLLGEEPPVSIRDWPGLNISEFRVASVLILLLRYEDEYKIVFTKRAQALRQHSGEVSFPGGRKDEEDRDLLHTALREADEEIGLKSEDVSVFGRFSIMPTISQYNLSAYIGEAVGPYDFDANPGEIDVIFEASLEALCDPSIYGMKHYDWEGKSFPMHEFQIEEHRIWGATGYMTYELLKFLSLIK